MAPRPAGDHRPARCADTDIRVLASEFLRAVTRAGWLAALVVGCLASGRALVLQSVVREAWQIRTLPERVMEWLLLFVPLDLFERGVQQLGGDAKEVALAATGVGMGVLLVAVGVLVLRAAWTSWWL